MLAEEREGTIKEAERKLVSRDEELRSLGTRYRSVEEQLTSADRQCAELRAEVCAPQTNYTYYYAISSEL